MLVRLHTTLVGWSLPADGWQPALPAREKHDVRPDDLRGRFAPSGVYSARRANAGSTRPARRAGR